MKTNEFMQLLGFHFQILFLSFPLQQADPLIRGEGPIKKRFASSAPLLQTPLLPSSSSGIIGNGRVGLSEGGGDGDDAPAPTLRGKLDINFKALWFREASFEACLSTRSD